METNNKNSFQVENLNSVDFDWTDSSFMIQGDEGMKPVGTCILLIGQIICLEGLTTSELKKLQQTVNTAVKHELQKRSEQV